MSESEDVNYEQIKDTKINNDHIHIDTIHSPETIDKNINDYQNTYIDTEKNKINTPEKEFNTFFNKMINPQYYEKQFGNQMEQEKQLAYSSPDNSDNNLNGAFHLVEGNKVPVTIGNNEVTYQKNYLEVTNTFNENLNNRVYNDQNLMQPQNDFITQQTELTQNPNDNNVFTISDDKINQEEIVKDLFGDLNKNIAQNQKPERNKSYMKLRTSKTQSIINKEIGRKSNKNSIQGISDITENQLLMCQQEFSNKKSLNMNQNNSPVKTKDDQIDSYNKLIEGLKYLKMMDWDSLNPSVFKNSPLNNPPLTTVCYWFCICSSYFIKREPEFMIQLLEVLLESLSDHKEAVKSSIPLPVKRKPDEESDMKDQFISSFEEYANHDDHYKEIFESINWQNVNSESTEINNELEKQLSLYKMRDSYNFDDFKKGEEPYKLQDDIRICFFRKLVYNLACQDNSLHKNLITINFILTYS